MAVGLKSLWMLPVVLLLSNWQYWSDGSIPQVPCLFVFGDSLFDNGNNNYLPGEAAKVAPKVDYLPYGLDFPSGATGRCSNGLNIADVIADLLGFDNYIPDFAMGSCSNILNGVNYASCGAGILQETGTLSGEVYTMDVQLYNHNILTSRVAKILGSDDVAKKYLGQCIYATDMGHNDYLNNYFLSGYNTCRIYNPEQFAELLIQKYEQQLKVLYFAGARKVAVFGLVRIGCMPMNIQNFPVDESLCAYELNDAVQIFNTKLQDLIPNLNANLCGASFTYINSYQIDSETNKGFKFTDNSCCEVPHSSLPCIPLSFPCTNRTEYVYWDGAHFTEAKATAFGKRAYERLSLDDASPYDIRGLVQLSVTDTVYKDHKNYPNSLVKHSQI